MEIRRLTRVDDVIDKLGGTVKFGQRYKKSKQQISNARSSGHLPSDIMLLVNEDLKEIGLEAAPSIFRVKEPKKPRVAA